MSNDGPAQLCGVFLTSGLDDASQKRESSVGISFGSVRYQ
jgi:hypothetical protein